MTCEHLLVALAAVEELPAAATGVLVAGDQERPAGVILVERNRVCWAAAAGLGRRLRELMGGPDESDEGRRAALERHTIESLLAIDDAIGAPWPLTWIERPGRVAPRHAFTAAHLLAAAGAAMLDELDAELVRDHLAGLAGTGCALLAFDARAEGGPAFFGLQTMCWVPVRDLVELASWADAALDASPGFSPVVTHACSRTSDGGTVAWVYENVRYAAICPSTQALRRLVAMLDNRSLAMVLATRLSVLERLRERMAIVPR